MCQRPSCCRAGWAGTESPPVPCEVTARGGGWARPAGAESRESPEGRTCWAGHSGCGIRKDRSGPGIWGGGAGRAEGQHGPGLPPGPHGTPRGHQDGVVSVVSPSRSLQTALPAQGRGTSLWGGRRRARSLSGWDHRSGLCGITEAAREASGSSARFPGAWLCAGVPPWDAAMCRVSRRTRRPHGVPSWGGAVPRPRGWSTVRQAGGIWSVCHRKVDPEQRLLCPSRRAESEPGGGPGKALVCSSTRGLAGQRDTPRSHRRGESCPTQAGGQGCPGQLSRVLGVCFRLCFLLLEK